MITGLMEVKTEGVEGVWGKSKILRSDWDMCHLGDPEYKQRLSPGSYKAIENNFLIHLGMKMSGKVEAGVWAKERPYQFSWIGES